MNDSSLPIQASHRIHTLYLVSGIIFSVLLVGLILYFIWLALQKRC